MKKNRLTSLLVLLMTSCGSVSAPLITPTAEVPVSSQLATSTLEIPATASPTSSPVTPSSTAQTSLPVAPPPTTQATDRPFSAILARMYPGSFLLLGGVENGEWLSPETAASHLADGEMYQTFGALGTAGSAKGSAPEYDRFCSGYWVKTDSYPFGGRSVAVTGDWNVMPRIAQELSTDHDTYIEVVRNWLIEQNFLEPVVKIDQILRVDVEGDGTEEVLISASHFVESTGHNVEPGDYSLVLMRKVAGNSAVTIPVIGDYYYQPVENQFPLTYGSLFVADLNGDGSLEILVGIERWEGSGVAAYEVDGTNTKMITKVFCGF
ncbi:MAG: hypothetical protein JNM55_03215 [Anaerolineales bacterium]|nr:hypothetical protein [Anaerolineales bacterium]